MASLISFEVGSFLLGSLCLVGGIFTAAAVSRKDAETVKTTAAVFDSHKSVIQAPAITNPETLAKLQRLGHFYRTQRSYVAFAKETIRLANALAKRVGSASALNPEELEDLILTSKVDRLHAILHSIMMYRVTPSSEFSGTITTKIIEENPEERELLQAFEESLETLCIFYEEDYKAALAAVDPEVRAANRLA